jgi:hypothetical protein
MAYALVSRNSSQNPDLQKDGFLGDGITPLQEQPISPTLP